MSEGWIKLHRKLRENPIYSNSNAIHCWIECLLRASHEKREVFLKREKVTLEMGQFVMGRDEFGKAIGVSGSTVWYWINQFFSDNMIDIKKTSKGTVISIKNWQDYQGVDSDVDNKKTADEQQMNTNKNVKNDKNVKNMGYISITPNQLKTLQKDFPYLDVVTKLEKFKQWQKAENRTFPNPLAKFRTWLLEDVDKQNKTTNVIMEDPIFNRLLTVYHATTGRDWDLKNSLIEKLNRNYEVFRYAKEWEEAKQVLNKSKPVAEYSSFTKTLADGYNMNK